MLGTGKTNVLADMDDKQTIANYTGLEHPRSFTPDGKYRIIYTFDYSNSDSFF